MIDFNRLGGTVSAPQGGVLIEKIDKIISDPNRSARIALVASGDHKRYIIATDSMQQGDSVKSTQLVSRSPGTLFFMFVCLSLSLLSLPSSHLCCWLSDGKGVLPLVCIPSLLYEIFA